MIRFLIRTTARYLMKLLGFMVDTMHQTSNDVSTRHETNWRRWSKLFFFTLKYTCTFDGGNTAAAAAAAAWVVDCVCEYIFETSSNRIRPNWNEAESNWLAGWVFEWMPTSPAAAIVVVVSFGREWSNGKWTEYHWW